MIQDNIATGIINLILFLLIIFFRKMIHQENVGSFLLHFDKRGRRLFLEGILSGILFFTLYPLITTIIGEGKIYISTEGAKHTLVMVLSGLFAYLSVSLLEESFFRGYMLSKLSIILPTNIAIIIPSVFFGLFHFQAYSTSETIWIGIINATLIGIILSIIVVRTGSLMLPLGYHLSWNLIQSIIFMDYKYNIKGLINLEVSEGLWTGYSVIPESGLIVTIICIIMFIYFNLRFRNYEN
ncbi:CPBP family intramembrane glutamic endopeptidase [Anaerosalibacter bizertensis]|uniref:CPBP family intramembrane glutamic endopeptidase n=1 Tax=Anaerosalibacter bizertensis TaxID=932217 RepID=UPI001D00FD97|nr:CPBP family intramembrane glutamic endopeptidase [Anaerosalibacter bizertensis]MCB5559537.1 CPBP family intramembrane metalloprotease [Anaerosalibacter bizertensis]MCG4586042.1 CPBP family intramembrane metalloprotease [Anaerosalibacter bizertensis]